MYSSFKLALLVTLLTIKQCCLVAAQPMSDEEFGDKVRDYILAHPEIILQAMDILGAEQEKAKMAERVAPFYDELIDEDVDLRIGSKSAETQIIEFFDYRCSVCKAVAPILKDLVSKNPEIAFVKKHLPVLSPASERAARYVMATNMIYGAELSQRFHEVLYSTRAALTLDLFEEEAFNLGLDHGKIVGGMGHPDIEARIELHRDIAIALEIRGTPAFLTRTNIKMGATTRDDLLPLLKE